MDDVTIRPAADRATKAAPAENFTGTVLQDAYATPEAPSRTSATLWSCPRKLVRPERGFFRHPEP